MMNYFLDYKDLEFRQQSEIKLAYSTFYQSLQKIKIFHDNIEVRTIFT